MIKTIDGAVYSRMVISAAASIENNCQPINDLNVFPVPDGDTGTNMGMTIGAASKELKKKSDLSLTKAADCAASALLRGARGNSGVILSLLFRGFATAFKGKTEADGTDFAKALSAGVEAAYKAVMKPAEGTILTVARLTAAKAEALAEENDEIEFVLENMLPTAKEALDNTVNQNPVLKKAGVVDAGGMGYLVIMEAMLSALRGNDVVCEKQEEVNDRADFTQFESGDITFAFDTVFIVRKFKEKSIEPFRAYLSGIGDCLVIGEDDEAFKVHVHTNVPGEAISEGSKYGTLELAKIENMRLQHDDLAEGREVRSTDDLEQIEKDLEQSAKQEEVQDAAPEKKYGVVSVCAGAGLAQTFRDLGVDTLVEGGQTMNPSTDDILNAVRKTPAEIVFVLPNNKNIIMAAQQASALAEKKVIVIPSATVPQGLTAMLNFDDSLDEQALCDAMTDCLSTVSTMQITYAARNSDFDGYDIHEGDYLGLYNGALLGTDTDVTVLLSRIGAKIAEEGKEFVNVFYGEGVSEEDAQKAASLISEAAPSVEINVIYGAQPIYYYLISAE